MKPFTIGLALALVGCAQVQQKVTLDSAAAVVAATADGSPAALARAACYKRLPMLAMPFVGLASLYEQLMEAQELSQGACAPVVAGIAEMVINHAPIPIP